MRRGQANLVWMWAADAHAKRKEGRSLFYGGWLRSPRLGIVPTLINASFAVSTAVMG